MGGVGQVIKRKMGVCTFHTNCNDLVGGQLKGLAGMTGRARVRGSLGKGEHREGDPNCGCKRN